MANSPMAVFTLMALGLAAALLSAAGPAVAQNCACQPGFCCSQYGYCGTTNEYCGPGCRSGPCIGSGGAPTGRVSSDGSPTGRVPSSGPSGETQSSGAPSGGTPSAGGGSVDSVVTDSFFNGIKSQSGGCAGQSFYTRQSFLDAAGAYPGFAPGGDKREIAAFFAHVTHETGHFCYIEEINPATDYCDPHNSQWPCYPGATYHGRGPLQLSWNYNYGPAGQSIGFDGLMNPQAVAQDSVVAFKAALWYWMNNVHGVVPQGFGATIRAINGALECNGNNSGQMNARVGYYQDYCRQLGVDAGDNLYC